MSRKAKHISSKMKAAIIVALIGAIPALLAVFLNPDLLEFFWAKSTEQAEGVAGIDKTATSPSETATIYEVLEDETVTVTPSSTQQRMPTLCCLSGWDLFSTINSSFSPSPQDDCPNIGIDEIGIHASDCTFVFALNAFHQRGISGVSMPLSHDSEIQVNVMVRNLIEGEIWIGFSKEIDPQADSVIYAMTPDPGGVSVYLNDISSPNSRYSWGNMGKNIGWVRGQPWRYKFIIKLNANTVSVNVDDIQFASVVAPSTKRFFIGYRSKPDTIGTYLNATILDLKITKP